MPWAKANPGDFWDNVRIMLLLGHRPAHISKLYDHKGDILQKIRWRSHDQWKDINVARTPRRGPRCPKCRLRLPTHKHDLCKGCYYATLRRGRPEGEDHHAWKGGTSYDPNKVRTSTEYRQFRKGIMEAADYQCSICGVIDDSMEMDHIVPHAARPDLLLVKENVRVLCGRCHKKTASYSANAKYFKWIWTTGRLSPEEKLEKLEELYAQEVISDVELATSRYFLVGDGRLTTCGQ